jgi:hypothetical protein
VSCITINAPATTRLALAAVAERLPTALDNYFDPEELTDDVENLTMQETT